MSEKGYEDKKEFICTACGKKIMLTKFASQKTCRCDECKDSGKQVNQDIVQEAMKNLQQKKQKQKSSGVTKICKCINCGVDTEVSKFMSENKVLCPSCKGTDMKISDFIPKINLSKLDRSKLIPIEEYEVNDSIIKNKKLREIKCPACGHEYMKPLMIADWSQFGLIIDYQCTECLLKMTISEQCHKLLNRYKPGNRFDYTGEEIKEIGISWVEQSRVVNSLRKLIKILEEHNIEVDDDEFKPYLWNNERPVPVGFEIPSDDKWIKIISDVIDTLKNTDMVSEDKEIANQLVDKLNKLLKGDINGVNE